MDNYPTYNGVDSEGEGLKERLSQGYQVLTDTRRIHRKKVLDVNYLSRRAAPLVHGSTTAALTGDLDSCHFPKSKS